MGGGGIYKIDAFSGAISNFISLPNFKDTKYHYQPGLGNICYDNENNQLFASNFEDGKIYRISLDGKILSTFDPFNQDDNLPGFADLGERLFGVYYKNSRLYYSRFVEEKSRPNLLLSNQIWSVPIINSEFVPVLNSLEINLPSFGSIVNYSYPVSDITFNIDGTKMFLAERTINTDNIQQYGHESRVLEYSSKSRFPGTWLPESENKYKIGDPRISNTSCAGGVTLGTKNNFGVLECDSILWVTGNSLRFFIGKDSSEQIYGIQGLPLSGGTISNSILVDADGDTRKFSKIQIGDVEVFKDCCSSYSVIKSDTSRVTIKDTFTIPIILNNITNVSNSLNLIINIDTSYLNPISFLSSTKNVLNSSIVSKSGNVLAYNSTFLIPNKIIDNIGYIKFEAKKANPKGTEITFSVQNCFHSFPGLVKIDDCISGGSLKYNIYGDTIKLGYNDTLKMPVICYDYIGNNLQIPVYLYFNLFSFYPLYVKNKNGDFLQLEQNSISGNFRNLKAVFPKKNKIGLDTLGYFYLLTLSGDTNSVLFNFSTDSCYDMSPGMALISNCGSSHFNDRSIEVVNKTSINKIVNNFNNQIVSLSFTVESDYNSKLFLYDSYGNLVKILFENQEFQNDENLLSFSISDFNSGIYYLALYSGANSSIKKLVFYK